MQDKMTWEEIKKSFPNEWVALDDYQLTEAIEVSGTIIAHHPNKKEFYTALSKIRDQHPDIAVRYTGKRIKNSEIPLLWQITGST